MADDRHHIAALMFFMAYRTPSHINIDLTSKKSKFYICIPPVFLCKNAK